MSQYLTTQPMPGTGQLVVRPLTACDVAAADEVLRAAFERPASFVDRLRLSLAIQPDGVLAAEEDGRIVGTVGAVDYGTLAYIGLMAVDPRCQGRGIGRWLITELLAWLDARGCPAALLDATDKGVRLYETLGFTDDGVARVFELARKQSAGIDARHPQREGEAPTEPIRRATAGDLDEIVPFDAQSFGADRRKLIVRLWQSHADRCLVARSKRGRLTGYLFARDPVLGPWVAESAGIAEALLAAALAGGYGLGYEQSPLVMAPRSNERCAELLARHGFVERRQLRHMRRGGHAPPRSSERRYGQSSFAHG